MTTDKATEALIERLKAALAEYDRYDPYISNEKIMKQAYEIIEEAREAATILRTQQDRIRELQADCDRYLEGTVLGQHKVSVLEAKLAEAMGVIKPFASVRYMGANAFNRADLSDNDFRAARAFMQKMEGGTDADNG